MMKKIIYSNVNGIAAVVTPAPGGRLAKWITLKDGQTLVSSEVGIVEIPEKLLTAYRGRINVLMEEVDRQAYPRPVDQFMRLWPIEGAVAEWAESEAEFIDRIAAKVVPNGLPYRIVDAEAIPADRTFRDAWKINADFICNVDMSLAREIRCDKIREARAPLLTEADVEMFKAIEGLIPQLRAIGINVSAVEAIAERKKALRDVTADPAIQAAQTPEQLKAVVPAVLL